MMEDVVMATVEESFIVSSDDEVDEDVTQSSSSSSSSSLDKDQSSNSTPSDTTVDEGTKANGNSSYVNIDNNLEPLSAATPSANDTPTTFIEDGNTIIRLENRIAELEERLSDVISQLVHFSNHTTNIIPTPPTTIEQRGEGGGRGVEIIHSRVNSETSCCYSTPDDDDDGDDNNSHDIGRWPPSHHCHLESPDSRICPNRQHWKQKQQRLDGTKNNKLLPLQSNKKKKKGKTMSMILLDESNSSYDKNYHGPRYLMPSSSDLDACDEDDDCNIDDNATTNNNKSRGELKYGRMITDDNNDDCGGITNNNKSGDIIFKEEEEEDGRSAKSDSGGNNDYAGEEIRKLLLPPPPILLLDKDRELEYDYFVAALSSPHDGSSYNTTDGNTEGIIATTIAGSDGTISPTLLCANDSSSTRTTSSSSAISPCNSTSSSSTVIPPPLLSDDNLKCQAYTDVHLEALHEHRKQSMDIADNGGNYDTSTGKLISITPKNVSTQTSFAELPGMLCDNTSANNQPQDLMCYKDPTDNISSNNNNNIDNDAGSSTASVAVGGKAKSITQSTSSASNLSLNTTTTSKTGNNNNNNNNRLPSRRSGGSSTLSGSFTAGVPSKSRPRSASCAIGSTTATTAISSFINDVTTNSLIDDFKTIDRAISLDIKQQHPSSHDLTSVTSNTTPVQSMREYVINDLLNIDSRNQDGSATEDVDENMEEFLRIPQKLEGLMLFTLAVCMDSFLYIWSMLPLKFIWGVISLACSLYSPTKGVRGVKFHRR